MAFAEIFTQLAKCSTTKHLNTAKNIPRIQNIVKCEIIFYLHNPITVQISET